MGRYALDWAFDQAVGGAAGKAVLLAIAKHANDAGVCFPRQATIARYASCDERTVRRWTKALEILGLLRRAPRYRQDGTRSSDFLMLPLPPREGSGGQSVPQPPDNMSKTGRHNVRAEIVREPNGSNDAERELDLSPNGTVVKLHPTRDFRNRSLATNKGTAMAEAIARRRAQNAKEGEPDA